MQTANAVKIGIWIVAALAILIFGTRFFQGLSLGGTNQVVSEFERVDGLIAGNPVQMRGVRIGIVNKITVDSGVGTVSVRMNIDGKITVREGAVARLVGIAALGDMRIEIEPGPIDAPVLETGAVIPSFVPVDLLGTISEKAEVYLDRIDEILNQVSEGIGAVNSGLAEGGDIDASLRALRSVTESLDALLQAEAVHLSNTIRNFESVSGNLADLTSSDSASVSSSLKQSLKGLDATLASTQSVTASLDSILIKMNRGDGTLGRLANDPSLYNHLDSVAVNLSRLLEDVRRDPSRYVKELRLIEIF